MTIKKSRPAISKRDLEDGLNDLGISVSECAKGSAVPRAYLSDLKNRGVPLRRDYDDKLRAFFEGRNVEFEDAPADDDQGDDRAQSPDPRLRAVKSTRCFFPVADTVPDDVVQGAMDLMDEDEIRLAVLLKQTAERDDGFLGNGELVNATKEALQEAGSLLAEIAVFFLMVRGWRALGVKPAGENPETLRDVLIATYRPRLETAGLLDPEPEPENAENGDGQGDEPKSGIPAFMVGRKAAA